jgi:hypothetical protein
MKKFFVLTMIFALALTACDAMTAQTEAPVVQPTAVPPTAEVVVVTVEVPVEPTAAPPTPVPADTQAPQPTPTVAPTQEAAAPTEPAAAPAAGAVNVDASLLGGVFSNISASGDKFSLRCNPKEISFDVTASDVYITQVDLFYRIRDKHSEFIPGWSYAATMETDGGDHFWLTYSGESVTPDNRKAQGWFDFQVVGINNYGDVVGRTEHIEGLVTYTNDCQ